MNDKTTLIKLQFDQIIQDVTSYAIGNYTKEVISQTLPDSNLSAVETKLQETSEARLIIDSGQHVPFMGLSQIKRLMQHVIKGMLLTPEELIEIADFLRSTRMIQKFFEKNQFQTPLLYHYSKGLESFLNIEEMIYQKIHHQKIADDASSTLRKLRKQISDKEKEIETRLSKFLSNPKNKTMIQESLIINKNEHYTIPINASYKNKVAGNIVEQSNKGTTAYIEPAAVTKLNEQISLLKTQEQAEEFQILAELTGYLNEMDASIDDSIELVTVFDIIFARAKYSRFISGVTPLVNKDEKITIIQGKHPLLKGESVPLDFELGTSYRGLVITGANAGGKTVVLKTVGLLTVMTMFGLQIPAQTGTEIAIMDHLFVDIGDQQAIENALSTFSGHMKNISEILTKVGRYTLVLLDELGSGTEPNEGASLAIAIMETLYKKGALVVTTTHYGEIKQFAESHADILPAAMAFDPDTLTPKYILQVGEVGESQALWIARKMHMPEGLLKKAAEYIQNKSYATEKISFPAATQKQKLAMRLPKEMRFQKGDRVLLKDRDKIGLVYSDEGSSSIQVFLEDQIQSVKRKRVELKGSASELYPEGYDLDSLFTDYHTRKRDRDLERGSKKAHKLLDKEIQNRRFNK
ncbi:endonuclease MutS2 [Alkalibacterium olivapovliticus]|uniref:DsDNA-specific endonuclease/ATPase MutS2 n=1 Tax=Alkalibacterium olivapovliticus TaxID=99907 RepID=A0A2T0WC58_9LACT|nr:mannonate oxidoreductase [Alkalibacterium olivapovliticus]PRY84277.1 dsDNA-specific endonuclease/ATPase MutS2 [Alkalibacterium olivapovliticus]